MTSKTKPDDAAFLVDATVELVALAARMRPTWDTDALRNAMAGARTAGWSWPKTWRAVNRLIAVEDADPWDLTHEVAADAGFKPQPSGSERPAAYDVERAALDDRAVG